MKFFNIIYAVTTLTVANIAHAGLIETVQNGGFETGNFDNWTFVNLGAGGCGANIWTVSTTGIHGCSDNNGISVVAPTQGDFAAYNTFDGPLGTLRLSQSILLPEIFNSLSLSWFQTVDINGSGPARTFSVDFLTSTNTLIGNVSSQQFSLGAFQNWTQFSFDVTSLLAGFAGQEVNLSFSNIIPVSFTGPGGFGLDNVSLQADVTEVPVPTTFAIFGLGLLAFVTRRIKQRA